MKTDGNLTTELIIEDPHVVGFLLLPKYHFEVLYQLNWSGRVGAVVRGDPGELKEAFNDLQNNVPWAPAI